MARAAAPRTDQPGRDQALGGQPGQPGPVEPAEPTEPAQPAEATPIGTEYTVPTERTGLRAWAGMNGWRGRSGAGQAGRMIAGPGLRRATGTR